MKDHGLDLGQLFVVGFDGLGVDSRHPVAEAISRHRLGGIILFDRNVDGSRQNISSPGQLRELTASLQQLADTPLLMAVDQEGGRVCRLKEQDGFPACPSAGQLGDRDDPAETARQAELMAKTMAGCGINFNLAPVIDLDLNPDNPIIGRYRRSYGRLTDRVVRHAAAFIRAHHEQGVACCLKHFPGHGSAAADSHLGFVDISGQWQEEELAPYGRLMADGFGDAVMTAHVVNRHLDPDCLPATLSAPIINGILRGRLRFPGVVVSDDLQMKAISARWDMEQAVARAVAAGIDLIIIGNNLRREGDAVARGIRAIENLLDKEKLSVEHVRRSLERIRVLKGKIAGEIPWTGHQPTT
jgi:beta-N-acetylhexosaminidase